MTSLAIVAACLLLACPPKAIAGSAVEPGALELERPTLICLGVSWQVRGDDNHNASATLEYRKEGQGDWQRGLDLFRVDPVALPQDRPLPADPETCFAGGLRVPGQVEEQFPVEANDLRLSPASGALDRGERRANINDGYGGSAPDLGAFEQGAELPPYGPRPAW